MKIKKVVSFVLALSLVMTQIGGQSVKMEAKKKPSSIRLTKVSYTLEAGKKVMLKAKVADTTKNKLIWTSSKKSVATVNQKGVVKAKKVGKATITVKVKGSKKKAQCQITVVTPEVKKKLTTQTSEVTTQGPTTQTSEVSAQGPTTQASEATTQASEVSTQGPTTQTSEVSTQGPTTQTSEVTTQGPTTQASEATTQAVEELTTEEPEIIVSTKEIEFTGEYIEGVKSCSKGDVAYIIKSYEELQEITAKYEAIKASEQYPEYSKDIEVIITNLNRYDASYFEENALCFYHREYQLLHEEYELEKMERETNQKGEGYLKLYVNKIEEPYLGGPILGTHGDLGGFAYFIQISQEDAENSKEVSIIMGSKERETTETEKTTEESELIVSTKEIEFTGEYIEGVESCNDEDVAYIIKNYEELQEITTKYEALKASGQYPEYSKDIEAIITNLNRYDASYFEEKALCFYHRKYQLLHEEYEIEKVQKVLNQKGEEYLKLYVNRIKEPYSEDSVLGTHGDLGGFAYFIQISQEDAENSKEVSIIIGSRERETTETE